MKEPRPDNPGRGFFFVFTRSSLALYLAGIVVFCDLYLSQPLLPLFGRTFGITPATAGLSVSVVTLMIALTSSVYGPLSDRLGRKRVMVSALAALAVPTALGAFAPSYPLLLVARAAQGALVAGVTGVAVAHIGDTLPPGRIGQAVGLWIASNVIGGLVGRVASGWIADLLDWRASFLAFAALTAVAALALRQWLIADAPHPGPLARSARADMAMHLRDPRLRSASVIGAALFFAFIGTFTYLPYLLTAPPYSLPTALVGSAYVTYIAGVFTSPLAGRLSTRVHRLDLSAAGLLIAALGLALTLLPSLVAILCGLLTLCVGNFLSQAVMPAHVNATAARAKGAASALYGSFYYGGAVLGAFLPGLALSAWGWPGVVGACVLGLLLALIVNRAARRIA